MRYLLLALSLLIASNAYAVTQVVRYVNGTCTHNGDGTASSCAAGVGLAGAHSNLANFISGVANTSGECLGVDLVARDVNYTVHLIAGAVPDSSDNFLDTGHINMFQHWTEFCDQFVVDATHSFHLVGDPDDPYRVSHDASAAEGGALIMAGYSSAIYMDIETTHTTRPEGVTIPVGARLEASTVHCANVGTTGTRAAIRINPLAYGFGTPTTVEARIVNNIVYGCNDGISLTYFGDDGAQTENTVVGLYNNSINDAGRYGIDIPLCNNTPSDCGTASDQSRLYLANNLIQGSGSADYHWGASCDTSAAAGTCFLSLGANATSDATSPDGSAFQNQTASFTNAGGRDYTLTQNDEACLYRAVDLRLNDFYPFSTDFQGEPRQNYWSCGGDNGTPNPKRRWGLTQGVDRLNEP